MSSPVLARCGKDCKTGITSGFHTCKTGCAKGGAGKDCRKACRAEKKADLTTCKKATNPTPPLCGETTAITTTTAHGSTTVTSTTRHLTTTT